MASWRLRSAPGGRMSGRSSIIRYPSEREFMEAQGTMTTTTTIFTMRKTLTLLCLLLSSPLCFGQAGFSLNEGESSQAGYFTSVPYENINGKLIHRADINGKPYRFILDTGAPTSISARLFDDLNPNLIAKIPISDANNKTDSLTIVRLNDIKIGNVEFTNIPALVIDNPVLSECFQVDGLIGSNLLRGSIVQIDNKSKTVVITDDEKKLSLNPKHASDLFLDKQSSPVITIGLKNKRKAKEQVLLDTGMNALYDLSLNNFSLFQEHEIVNILASARGSNAMGLFGLAQDTVQYRLHLPEMEINNVKILNLSAETTTDDNSRIGSSILDYGVMTIDYKNKKFYLSPYDHNAIDASEKAFPIDYVPRNNQLHVSFVWDTTIADKIAVGDQIIAVDNISYAQIDICDLVTKANIFKGKDSVNLVTRNSRGERVETVLERK